MSPVFHSFLLAENFFFSEQDFSKTFKDPNPMVSNYLKVALDMLNDEKLMH